MQCSWLAVQRGIAMITKAQVKELFPRAPSKHVNEFASSHATLFKEFGIDRSLFRLHFFIAQIGHESGGFTNERENMHYSAKRLTEVWPSRFADEEVAAPFANNPEKLGNQVYANRNGNGPPESGDGFRFRGRGYMQLTGRAGYSQVGKLCGLDLVADPDKVSHPSHALRVALAFWKWKSANPVCDTGDFEAVTRKVNGGKIGWDDRVAWLDKVRRVATVLPSKKLQPKAALVILIQKALRQQGYNDIGAADGMIGKRTLIAINDYRLRKGLGNGVIDDLLVGSLGIIFP
jgi:putative chitinase